MSLKMSDYQNKQRFDNISTTSLAKILAYQKLASCRTLTGCRLRQSWLTHLVTVPLFFILPSHLIKGFTQKG